MPKDELGNRRNKKTKAKRTKELNGKFTSKSIRAYEAKARDNEHGDGSCNTCTSDKEK